MKIALISDTHIGLTTEGQIKAMLREMARQEFDVLVHAGDYGGTTDGAKCVKRTVAWMREFFPNKPIVSTIGNHDHWCTSKVVYQTQHGMSYRDGGVPSPDRYRHNLDLVAAAFKDAGIHYLDRDGIFVMGSVILIGVCGWYNHPNPSTNDCFYTPMGLDGDTNRTILKEAEDALFRHEAVLKDVYRPGETTVVFVSHFPVVNAGDDYKGGFEKFSWREGIARFFQETYNCRYFLCGHAHQRHTGPLRYEAGPDYQKPRFLIVEVAHEADLHQASALPRQIESALGV